MSQTAALLKILQRRNYVPMPVEALIRALDIPPSAESHFLAEVDELLKSGRIVRIKGDRLVLPEEAGLVTGILRFRTNGSAILLPEKGGDPLYLNAEDTHTALHGDRVVARLESTGRRYRTKLNRKGEPVAVPEPAYARVIRILERGRTTLTGTLQKSRLYYYVIPDDPRIVQDILVSDPLRCGIKPVPQVGDKVALRLLEWEQRHLNPQGEIIEVLGKTHTPFAEYKAILHNYGLDPDFPPEVLAEVASLPPQVLPEDVVGREDFRGHLVFTIDPDDAKDFDDALHLEKLPEGGWRVGIHIADVSAYVRSGTALDREAERRGNSTYLVGTVIPMLPPALSNGLCSLVENEDRLTKSAIIDFNEKGKEVSARFCNSVIRSRKRLTYRQAHALLQNDDLEQIRALPLPAAHQTGATGRPLASLSDGELRRLQVDLRNLWEIARQLRRRRMSQGSLDLNMPEYKIFCDEQGYACRIERIEYDESHQLIEEFMLAANEAVARLMRRERFPCIYRVHEEPDEEKLNEFREYLGTFGINVGDLALKKEIARALFAIRQHPQAHHLRTQFLRSLKQACYKAVPEGHYGLAKKDYTHFTSPIRRYSDTIVHRVLQAWMEKRGYTRAALGTGQAYTQEALEAISAHISGTEQNSAEAERESQKIKQMEFFERELAKPVRSNFAAVITEIKNHGFFVELVESQAYGLVHVSSLKDDLYELAADGRKLVGRRHKRTFHLGETIQVQIAKVDRFKRQLDFTAAAG